MITFSYKVMDYVFTVRYFYFSTSFLKVAEVAISQMLILKSSFLHTEKNMKLSLLFSCYKFLLLPFLSSTICD
jgi:hypothetical protein